MKELLWDGIILPACLRVPCSPLWWSHAAEIEKTLIVWEHDTLIPTQTNVYKCFVFFHQTQSLHYCSLKKQWCNINLTTCVTFPAKSSLSDKIILKPLANCNNRTAILTLNSGCNSSPLLHSPAVPHLYFKWPCETQLHLCCMHESCSMTSVNRAFLSGNLIHLCHMLSMYHSSPLRYAMDFLQILSTNGLNDVRWGTWWKTRMLHGCLLINDFVITTISIKSAEG